jgi:hypothetical protein
MLVKRFTNAEVVSRRVKGYKNKEKMKECIINYKEKLMEVIKKQE